MQATVSWAGDVKFEATTETGHQLTMDGPAQYGGQNQGPRPMEMILLGVGGCSSFDVVQILKKSRQQVTTCVAELSAERVDEVPAVFKSIHLHFKVSGSDLNPKMVARAVSLSAEKYCSASIMLGKGGVAISHSYEITEQAEG